MGTCRSSKVPAARVTRGSWWQPRGAIGAPGRSSGPRTGPTKVHSLSSPTTVNQLVTTQVLEISKRQRQRPHTTESAQGYISPPTWGGAFARIISLSVPHWPTAAPYWGGAVAPVRRPHILHVATRPRSRRATGSMLKKPYKNDEPRTGTARPPLGESRYEQPRGGDDA